MRSEGLNSVLTPLQVAILLNSQDFSQISISNTAYTFPHHPDRDYAVSYGSLVVHIPRNTEYHPPRDDIPPEKKLEYQQRSLKRTRRTFINYTLANDFRYMLTLTLDPNHPKFSRLKDTYTLRQTFQDIYRNNGHTYNYLAVCELQKNGNPHLHILATKELKKHLTKNKHKHDTFSAWRYGFSNIRKIKKTDYEKQTSYLTKYLFKEKDKTTYNYFKSKNIQKPKRKLNIDLSDFALDTTFITEYGITVYNYKRRSTQCKK